MQDRLKGEVLRFAGPLAIVGGGTVRAELLGAVVRPGWGLIGADSGGDAILAAGLVPDAVIGDLDSVLDLTRFPPETRVIAIPEQQTTDFEKALYSTQAPVTLAFGMTGGRLDHTLAALHAMARHATTRRIVLVDGEDVAVAVVGDIALEVPEGTRVSIYPMGRVAFARSAGLAYPLDGLVMEPGVKIGTSNTATGERISISVTGGANAPWLLIVPLNVLGRVLEQIQELRRRL